MNYQERDPWNSPHARRNESRPAFFTSSAGPARRKLCSSVEVVINQGDAAVVHPVASPQLAKRFLSDVKRAGVHSARLV